MTVPSPDTQPVTHAQPEDSEAKKPGFSFSLAELMLGSLAAGTGMAVADFPGPVVFFVFGLAVVTLLGTVLRYVTGEWKGGPLGVPAVAGMILLAAAVFWLASLLPLVEFLVVTLGLGACFGFAPIAALAGGGRVGLAAATMSLILIVGPFMYGYCLGVVEAEIECSTDARTIYTRAEFFPEDGRDPETKMPARAVDDKWWISERARMDGHNWRIRATFDGGRLITQFPWAGLLLTGVFLMAQFGILRWYHRRYLRPRPRTPAPPGSEHAAPCQQGHEASETPAA